MPSNLPAFRLLSAQKIPSDSFGSRRLPALTIESLVMKVSNRLCSEQHPPTASPDSLPSIRVEESPGWLQITRNLLLLRSISSHLLQFHALEALAARRFSLVPVQD